MLQRQRQRRPGITTTALKDWYVTTYYDMTPQLDTMTDSWIVETGLYEAMKKIALERIEEESEPTAEPPAPVLAETPAPVAEPPEPPPPVLAEPMEP